VKSKLTYAQVKAHLQARSKPCTQTTACKRASTFAIAAIKKQKICPSKK